MWTAVIMTARGSERYEDTDIEYGLDRVMDELDRLDPGQLEEVTAVVVVKNGTREAEGLLTPRPWLP